MGAGLMYSPPSEASVHLCPAFFNLQTGVNSPQCPRAPSLLP